MIGKSVPRVDAYDKVTGRAKFTDDMAPANCLIAKVCHAKIGNGMVKSIDTSKAEALEFVIRENSSVVGVELKDLRLKNNLLVGCINRGGKVLIPRGDDCLMVGDTVVVVTSQKCLRDIEDILEK